jgi:hypothetical protein
MRFPGWRPPVSPKPRRPVHLQGHAGAAGFERRRSCPCITATSSVAQGSARRRASEIGSPALSFTGIEALVPEQLAPVHAGLFLADTDASEQRVQQVHIVTSTIGPGGHHLGRALPAHREVLHRRGSAAERGACQETWARCSDFGIARQACPTALGGRASNACWPIRRVTRSSAGHCKDAACSAQGSQTIGCPWGWGLAPGRYCLVSLETRPRKLEVSVSDR